MFNTLLHILFPESCLGCNAPSTALCAACISSIPLANNPNPLVFALYDYNNPLVQKIVRNFKYHRKASAARALFESGYVHIMEYISESMQSAAIETLYLVPIPQHRTKTLLRGFNQSHKLAVWIKRLLPHAVVQRALIKPIATLPQARTQSRSERAANVAHSMKAKHALDPHALYIVIDDVSTTGATCSEAKRALQEGGAVNILSISLAHGYK
jgi:ComF family protein